jgi:hypothetical protein
MNTSNDLRPLFLICTASAVIVLGLIAWGLWGAYRSGRKDMLQYVVQQCNENQQFLTDTPLAYYDCIPRLDHHP